MVVASDPFISADFRSNEGSVINSSDLDLNLCQFPYYPTFQEKRTADYSFDEPKHQKRLKNEPPVDGSNNNSGGFYGASSNDGSSISDGNNSFNSLPKLQFRDYVWAYAERFLAIEAMEEAAATLTVVEEEKFVEDVKEETGVDGMKLVQQLIACAEAVACRDKVHASVLLSELRANALVFGTSFQRVASCFVQGLSDRLTLVQPLGTVGVLGSPAKAWSFSAEKDEALTLAYELCPQIQFGHFVANASILEALEGESSIHVVDLGMTLGLPHGQQWQQLMHSLASRSTRNKPAPRLRITGVGSSAERLQAIGFELDCYAGSLGLSFEFMYIRSSLENLKPEHFEVQDGEAVVINSILQMHCVVKESRGALNSVLQVLNELSPKAFVLVEQDSNHNGPFFLGRFMESLHYYSAIFDSLDSMLPKYDTRRAKIEQFYFADEIKNIVSCEGSARVERHERADQWRRRMSRAGFQASPLKMLAQAKQWMGKAKFCDGYTVNEEKGCLILGWQSRPVIAASCWKCSKI
ncbi:GRAS family protein RAD1 [Linum perenne]